MPLALLVQLPRVHRDATLRHPQPQTGLVVAHARRLLVAHARQLRVPVHERLQPAIVQDFGLSTLAQTMSTWI